MEVFYFEEAHSWWKNRQSSVDDASNKCGGLIQIERSFMAKFIKP